MARNSKGVSYDYLRIRDVMREMKSEKLRRGVSVETIEIALMHRFPDVLEKKLHSRQWISDQLKQSNVDEPRSSRSWREVFSKKLGRDCWTLATIPGLNDPDGNAGDLVAKTTEFSESKAEKRARRMIEGARILRNIQVRTRSVLAGQFKKSLKGFLCEVCDFSFGDTYGAFAEDFIEAHHVRPLSQGERETGLGDFRAVCSNCHRMLHWKGLRTVEELKALLKK